MTDYQAHYKMLCKYQPTVRTKHLTDLCLSYLNSKILKDFDSVLFNGMILIDLQKALDTINHNILFKKLMAMGFCDDTVSWLHSYLTDWVFLVTNEIKYSST